MFSFCNEDRISGKMVRREFLRAGSLGLGAMAGGGLLGQSLNQQIAYANQAKLPYRDKSVIFLFMHGGPSQYETFDPKMDAPSSIRSATGEIATTIPGVTFGSTFQQLAARAHLFNVVRSFVTGNGNHDIKPVMSKETLQANLGALYSRIAGPLRADSAMPTNIVLYPGAVDPDAGPPIKSFGNFESSGDLGNAFVPFVPGAASELQEDMKLHLPASRLEDRRSLLSALDHLKKLADSNRLIEGANAIQQQAIDALIRGVADAFDLSKENSEIIQKYDTRSRFSVDRISQKWKNHKHYVDHGSSIGRLLLLARRLCERGCGFVTITTSFVWDMHADVNNAPMIDGMDYVGAPFDHAVSAFIDDVQSRGLQDRILLVCCGEMGRTPKLNQGGGRDHWGNLAPLLLYGGGLKSGQVIGQSSHDGGQPSSDAVTIPDLVSTIMHALLDLDQVRLTSGLPRNLLEVLGKGRPILLDSHLGRS